MNATGFLQCLSGNNFQSGNLVAYYDFSQKDSKIVFNQIYPTGSGYSGALINSSSVPGIFLGIYPSVGGQVSTQIGNALNLSQIQCLFDFDFSGCQNSGQVESTILLTNRSTSADLSGFIFGINSSNRLFFENNGQIQTLNAELRNKNLINLTISSNQYVSFGFYDFVNSGFVGQSLITQLNKSFNSLYLLGCPSGSHSVYSGAMGSLNHFVLLQDNIPPSPALNCLFCTGASIVNTISSGTLITVSGVSGQNIYQSGITGYTSSFVSILKEDGSTVSLALNSGVSGSLLIDTLIVPILASGATVYFTGQSQALQYNTGEAINYASFNALFAQTLSGMTGEIYSYPVYQPYKNINVSNLVLPNYPSLYPNVYINGLLEAPNIDYYIYGSTIVIANNVSSTNTVIISFSNNPASLIDFENQFPVNTSGAVAITGSGFHSGYDVYQNGKKLIKNQEFYTGLYNSQTGILFYSGILETADELQFLPIDTAPITFTTGSNANYTLINGISGFSEQIWLNGILQTRNSDYYLTQPCMQNRYFLPSNSPLIVYNNDGYFLNYTLI
jgi:hypothetical protein